MITEPGLILDLDEAEYHADPLPEPSLSSSLVKLLIERSPLHAWHAHPRLNPAHQSKNKRAFDLGKAAHKLLLGKGAEIVVVNAAGYQTKAAREERDEVWAGGKIPLLPHEFVQVKDLARAVRHQIDHHEDAQDAFLGDNEVTLVWQEDNGVWCRCRPDGFPKAIGHGSVIDDLKTTKTVARPETFGSRTFWDLGYHISAAWYLRGIKAVTGVDMRFRFIVAEIDPPHAVSVLEMTEQAYEHANELIETAIETWGHCLRTLRWPGYSRRVEFVSPPTSRSFRMADIQATNRVTADQVRSLMALQAPLEVS